MTSVGVTNTKQLPKSSLSSSEKPMGRRTTLLCACSLLLCPWLSTFTEMVGKIFARKKERPLQY